MTESFGAETAPDEGLVCPAIILSKVDFPAPFFPIRAILSFSLMAKEILLKSAVPPCWTDTLSTEIIRKEFEAAKLEI